MALVWDQRTARSGQGRKGAQKSPLEVARTHRESKAFGNFSVSRRSKALLSLSVSRERERKGESILKIRWVRADYRFKDCRSRRARLSALERGQHFPRFVAFCGINWPRFVEDLPSIHPPLSLLRRWWNFPHFTRELISLRCSESKLDLGFAWQSSFRWTRGRFKVFRLQQVSLCANEWWICFQKNTNREGFSLISH